MSSNAVPWQPLCRHGKSTMIDFAACTTYRYLETLGDKVAQQSHPA